VQHIHHTLQVHKHVHIRRVPKHQQGPSVCQAPLPGPQLLLPTPQVPSSPAGPNNCKHAALTYLSHKHLTLSGPPRIPAWTSYLPDTPSQTWVPLPLTGPAWSLNTHAHPMHTRSGEGTEKHLYQLTPDAWTVTHGPAPAARTGFFSLTSLKPVFAAAGFGNTHCSHPSGWGLKSLTCSSS